LAEATGTLTLQTFNSATTTVGNGNEILVSYGQTFDSSGIAKDDFTVIAGTIVMQCQGLASACASFGIGAPILESATTADGQSPTNTTKNTVVIPFLAGSTIPSGTFTITVVVRIDVHTLYPGGGGIYCEVSAYVPSTPSLTISGSISIPQKMIAVQPEPALITSFGAYNCKCGADGPEAYYNCSTSATAQVLLCLGVIQRTAQYAKSFSINVAEGFTHALTSESYESLLDTGSSSPGYVTNGSLITVVLSNVPAGFGIAPGDPFACGQISVADTPYSCSPGSLRVSKDYISGTTGPYYNPGPGSTSETFEYQICELDAGSPENVNLPFTIYSNGPITSGTLPCVVVNVYKNPDSILPPLAIPTFVKEPEAYQTGFTGNVVCFNNCETNLLFPLVLVTSGWDTDFAISNTTLDPLALIGAGGIPPGALPNPLLVAGSATPQSGVCTNFLYSNGSLIDSWPTTTISAGSTWAADLGGSRPLAAGHTGYIWTKCEFSQAYGYAAIDWALGISASGVYSNYLAINVPDPEWSPRDLNGDGMGENTLTPFNINRRLEQQLSGLYGGHGHH